MWVLIVTLIAALLSATLLTLLHTGKTVRKAEAILLRAEQLDKEKKNDKRKKDDDEE